MRVSSDEPSIFSEMTSIAAHQSKHSSSKRAANINKNFKTADVKEIDDNKTVPPHKRLPSKARAKKS